MIIGGNIILYSLMLSLLFNNTLGSELLDGVPILFKLEGNISYIPSFGGVPIPGYKLTIEYNKYQWIGIRFQSVTTANKYDVIVVQRSTIPSFGSYLCTYSDFSTTKSQPNVLIRDIVNNQDYYATSNSSSNKFGLEIMRTKGQTNGQDWQGGEFTDICFFTSSKVFNEYDWSQQMKVCYGYNVNTDYTSKLVGTYLKNITFENVETLLYGGMQGPVLKAQIFALIPKPNFVLSSLFLKLGNKLPNNIGYDYCKCQFGDYYGFTTNTLIKDIQLHGYQDSLCTIQQSTQYNKITFIRYADTADQYDSKIYSPFPICLISTTQVCTDIQLPLMFPTLTVKSAIKVWEMKIMVGNMLIICFLILYL